MIVEKWIWVVFGGVETLRSCCREGKYKFSERGMPVALQARDLVGHLSSV